MDLDRLDGEVAGPMRVRHRGHVLTLPPAVDFTWKEVVAAAMNLWIFGTMIWPSSVRIGYADLRRVQAAWGRHNGLPEGEQVRRLVYMMQRYSQGIEYDLRHHLSGLSAGDLWRERRWRELLNYIDLLPTDSHMNRLLTSDEEYMEMALRHRKESNGPPRPSMSEWSLTNSLLAQVIDAVHANTAVNRGIADPKRPMPRVDPVPRPYTAAEKVRYRMQQRRHEEMVAMLLPGRSV